MEYNDIQLLHGDMGWSEQTMKNLVRKKMRAKPVTSVKMNCIACESGIMNELLEFTVESIAEEGL